MFIRLEILQVFWLMAVIYSEVLKCSQLCHQLAVAVSSGPQNESVAGASVSITGKIILFHLKNLCLHVTQCTPVSVVIFL